MSETIPLEESERTRCEIWTRVMGYHRPIESWNAGKQQEHADRMFFRDTTRYESCGVSCTDES